MQPSDIGRLVGVADPRLSPDGRRVAFVVSRVDLEGNRYRSAVWLAAADGSSPPFPLTAGEHGDAQPAWSPDGRRLAFTRMHEGTGSLHVLPVDGPGEMITVCARPEAVEAPVWSPDGTRIAFASRERAGRYSDGDDERSRPPRRIDRLFSRVDGEGWTIDRPRGVFVVAAAGSGVWTLVAGGPWDHGDPAWAPDGRTLAVTAARGKDRDLEYVNDVYLVPADGSAEPSALTDRGLSHARPAFSPDGTRIATLTTDERLMPSHSQVTVLDVAGLDVAGLDVAGLDVAGLDVAGLDVAGLDVAGGTQRILTAGIDRQCSPHGAARAPIWDGDALLFATEDHGNTHVHRITPDGRTDLLVGGTRAALGYDHAGETLAFVASTPTALPELFVRSEDGTERQLTSVGAAFHAAVPTAEPEHFTVPSSAGDGDVDAWIVRPLDAAEGDSVPVLLSIHGGPMTQYATAWFDEFQLWAGAGYAVVYCNPHGSTGHTDAWARAIRPPEAAAAPGTGWGGIDADDVLAVLDAALARDPALDPDRVGVLGGSYGGYLTSWLVSHTDRFAAACSERACNNLESEEWSSDSAGYFRYEFGVTHLEAPEVYRRMSPMSSVQDIHTPLLILHSEDDLRCPVEQADQLFVALRMLGRPVEYWRFPEEGHELSRGGSPRHRVQRAEIILDWFGRHLGGRRPQISWDHPSRTA